jgi:hypothetical protein
LSSCPLGKEQNEMEEKKDDGKEKSSIPIYKKSCYVSDVESDEMFKTWIESGSTARVAEIHQRAHTTVLRIKKKHKWNERKAKIQGNLHKQTDRTVAQGLKDLDNYLSECIAKGVTDFLGRGDSGVNAGGLSSLIKTKMELRGITNVPSGDIKELGLFYGIIAELNEEQIDRLLSDGKSILERLGQKAAGKEKL